MCVCVCNDKKYGFLSISCSLVTKLVSHCLISQNVFYSKPMKKYYAGSWILWKLINRKVHRPALSKAPRWVISAKTSTKIILGNTRECKKNNNQNNKNLRWMKLLTHRQIVTTILLEAHGWAGLCALLSITIVIFYQPDNFPCKSLWENVLIYACAIKQPSMASTTWPTDHFISSLGTQEGMFH